MAMIMERALTCAEALLRVISGSISAICQRRARTRSRTRLHRRSSWVSCSMSCLLDGGAMLKHVGAHTRLGFDVGGGIGVKACGFCGTTVGHGSREDQAGIGHFLVCDEVGDVIFRHSGLRLLVS